MANNGYDDYKYCIQDTSRVYVGCKFSFSELLESDEVPFKLRMLIDRYLLPKSNPQDTLESYFYYLQDDGFELKIYEQLKVRIKVAQLTTKKSLFGKNQSTYETKILTISQLVAMSPEEKKASGIVIQEMAVSKLAMAMM
jgi:hypothetical protein